MKQAIISSLLETNNRKPLDTGCGALTASIDESGLVRSINTPHHKHGYITLSSLTSFPNEQWYDSKYVRQYRKLIAGIGETEQISGFGILPEDQSLQKERYFIDNHIPLFVDKYEHFKVTTYFIPFRKDHSNFLIQHAVVENLEEREAAFNFQFAGLFNINRCSYGQLTEGGPIPLPKQENQLAVSSNQVKITNPHLPSTARIFMFKENCPITLKEYQSVQTKPVAYNHYDVLQLQKRESQSISVVYTFDSVKIQEIIPHLHTVQSWINEIVAKKITQPIIPQEETFIIERNVNYIQSCCSVPVEDQATCIITDHQLLPLSWNRDAYYMMQLLMTVSKSESSPINFSDDHTKQIVRGHLIWMFERADRPDGYWGRAYLTNGYCKDNAFQLDQQCYPLLELCDYIEWSNDDSLVDEVSSVIKEILDLLMDHKAEEKWLFRTGETPADDEVSYPYHFSSQILLWRMLIQLNKLNKRFSFEQRDLLEWAERVKKDTLYSFQTTFQEKTVFAYLTDLKGQFQIYHDANDLPTVYAPLWGFCSANDECWMETMKLALSEKNQGGYYSGKYGGLGSVHTPFPWPLGDAQALLFYYLTGNQDELHRVRQKLLRIVQWDGLFSEAINPQTGKVESRHWFSWPGSFISHIYSLIHNE